MHGNRVPYFFNLEHHFFIDLKVKGMINDMKPHLLYALAIHIFLVSLIGTNQ